MVRILSSSIGGLGIGVFISWLELGGNPRLVVAIIIMTCFFAAAPVVYRPAVDFGAEAE